MKEKRPTTFDIDSARRYAELLQDHADKVIKGSLFKPRSVAEILSYLRTLSDAKANIWEKIRKTYPETINVTQVSLDAINVTWELPETLDEEPPTPA